MRVVWIVPGFSSDERDWCIPALLDLARVMAQRCELHIVALRYPYRRDRYSVYGATVHSIGGGHRGPLFAPSIWRAAWKVIDRLRADVLHAFWLYEPGWIAARSKYRAPIVISLAGGELIDLPSIGYGLAGNFLRCALMRWSLRRADVVTAGSKYLIEVAKKFAAMKRVEFAPLGVDTSLFGCLPERSEGSLRDGREIPRFARNDTQESIILNVGSLEPVKDQAMLLYAFQRVHQQLPNTKLIIAGEGNLRSRLQALANELHLADCVEFRGEAAHDRLPELYHSASLFVQASKHEAQGMAILEAAACGLPIVGTRVGALADLAPNAAIATSIGDVEQLAQAMIDVLRQPDGTLLRTFTELGRAARSIVESNYALDRSVDRFIAIYRSMIDQS